ncbi:hypothetical protein SAMN05444359_101226 [Neolewinella agarilytica]|uniref:Uncharacterized protein n=1 Tax=Neolewinella agarilytica TaxID=478744 RepID=A0A1H8Z916_9BACT|nr:hypothetical protein SAMN05444359_101226 [Neolewinella agarilytica]
MKLLSALSVLILLVMDEAPEAYYANGYEDFDKS